MEKESELQKEKQAKAYEKKQALQKKRRELKGTKKLLHAREDIFIFVIHMSQLIESAWAFKNNKKEKNYNYY